MVFRRKHWREKFELITKTSFSMKSLYCLVAAMALCCACSDDPALEGTDGAKLEPGKLYIIAEVGDPATKSNAEGLVENGHPWVDGDEVRLFTLDYDAFTGAHNVTRYEGADKLNKAYKYVAADRSWTNVEGAPITLSNIKARMYAYSPSFPVSGNDFYNGDASLSPLNVPIVFNTPNKVDFLYGTHRNTKDGTTSASGDNSVDNGGSEHVNGTNLDYIDNKNSLLRLYLKHAQTYVRIRLLREAINPEKIYPGEGKVTALELMQLKAAVDQYGRDIHLPADGEHGAGLPSKGYIDITSGLISPTAYQVAKMTDLIDGGSKTSFMLNPTVAAGATPSYNEAYCLLAPCSSDMVRGFHIRIDEVDFYIACSSAKKAVEWKAGFQYTYDLVLTGKGLELVKGEDGEVVTVKPWNDGGTTEGDF